MHLQFFDGILNVKLVNKKIGSVKLETVSRILKP